MGLDARLVSFARRFLFCFLLQENQVIALLKEVRIVVRLEKKSHGCVNRVDKEYYRRASNFFPINHLKTTVSISFSRDAVGNRKFLNMR